MEKLYHINYGIEKSLYKSSILVFFTSEWGDFKYSLVLQYNLVMARQGI
jgi:hypothetical protein